MTLDPDFKVTALFERQITTTWYNIELYVQWQSNNKSYIMIYRMAPFSTSLNGPYPDFKVTPLFDAEYLRYGTKYIVSMEY